MNGLRLRLTNDEAYDLIYGIAPGELNDVNDIAERPEEATGRFAY